MATAPPTGYPLAPAPGPAPAVPVPPAPGFGAGLRAVFSGFRYVFSTPDVWSLAAVPMIALVVLGGLLVSAAIGVVPGWVAGAVGPTEGLLATIGATLLEIVATVAAAVAGVMVAFSLAQPLSGPALEALVRRREASLGAPLHASTPFLVDIGRSLQSMLVGYAIGLLPLIGLFVLSVLVPGAVVVTTPLKVVVAAFILAWDMCDYPLTVRGLPVGVRLEVLWRYKLAVLGFSFAFMLLSLVPCCLVLFFLPGGVVGATELLWAIEQHERTRGRGLLAGPDGERSAHV